MAYRTDPRTLRGSITPLVTPFTADGAVDHASLANLVRWQLASGAHGISIGGSTGEPSAQTLEERLAAIRTVVDTVAEPVPVIPGTGSARLDETLELTAAARDLGVDAVLIISPYYARPTQEALYVWYKSVAENFPDLPVVAYNVPARTSADIAPAAHAQMYEAWSQGHYGLHPLVDLLFVETNPAPAKWVLAQRGLIASGHVRPPLIPPTPPGLEKIRAYLAAGAEYLTAADGHAVASGEPR